jgi:hypothetical protein
MALIEVREIVVARVSRTRIKAETHKTSDEKTKCLLVAKGNLA